VRAAGNHYGYALSLAGPAGGLLGLLLFTGFFRATTQLVGSGWLSLGSGVGVLAGAPVAIVAAITLIGIPAFAEVARAVFGCELRSEKFGLESSRGGHLESPLSFCCFLRSVIYLVSRVRSQLGRRYPSRLKAIDSL
jgi:hypothetical protein